MVNQNSAYNTVINARADLFKGNKSLATRLVNAFETSDVSEATKKYLKGFNKKLQGKKASGSTEKAIALEDGAVAAKTVSSSQQSFTQQIEHLRAIVTILTNEPSYKPNEVALKVSTINDLLNQLILANAQVSAVNVALSNARLEPDEILYKEGTGLYDSSLDVKKYVKAIFGATSPAYKQVSCLKFTKR